MKSLPAERIHVKVSKDYVSSWIPEGKDGHERWESTSVSYDAPYDRAGVKQILTQEEQDYLEKVLGPNKPKGWMNVGLRDGNVWQGTRDRFKVNVPYPEGLILELDRPIEYIHYKILLANTRDIAPSFEESKNGKYLFYLEKESDKNKALGDKMKTQMEVHKKFVEVSSTFEKIYNFFAVAYRGNSVKLPIDQGLEASKVMLYEYAEQNPQMFLDILNDVNYKYKVIYFKGIIKGAFVRKDNEVRASYINGAVVGHTIEDVVEYIQKIEKSESPKEFQLLLERIK